MRSIFLAGLLLVCAVPAHAACDGQEIARHVFDAPVCVPAEPKRIVALDPLLTIGMLHELGVPVIGAPLSGIQDGQIREEAVRASVVDIGQPLQPSLELVLGLEPDLIIGASDFHAQIYGTLSRIAPTLLIDHIGWKDHFRLLAEMTGRTDAAEDALRDYERRVASIRERVPDIEVSVARVRQGGVNVYLDGPAAYAPYAVLQEAGVKRTAYETTTDNTVVRRPDWEEASEVLTGDVLLYVVIGGYDPAGDDALAEETTANPLWQMLPAVRAGRAHRIDRATWMGFRGIASAHRVLDDVERYVLTSP